MGNFQLVVARERIQWAIMINRILNRIIEKELSCSDKKLTPVILAYYWILDWLKYRLLRITELRFMDERVHVVMVQYEDDPKHFIVGAVCTDNETAYLIISLILTDKKANTCFVQSYKLNEYLSEAKEIIHGHRMVLAPEEE